MRREKKKEKGREGTQEKGGKREMERETTHPDGVQVQVPVSTMMHKLFPMQKTQLEPQNIRITQPIRITCNLDNTKNALIYITRIVCWEILGNIAHPNLKRILSVSLIMEP